MHCLILSQLSSVRKIIYALNESNISFEIINTDPSVSNEFVPDDTDRVKVLSNIYKKNYTKITKIMRFLNGLSSVAAFFNKFSSQTKNLDHISNFDFILANWGVGIIPELNILKSHRKFKKTKSILNLETFPTSWNSRIREWLEIFILKKSLKNIDALIVPSNLMLDFLIATIPQIKEKNIYNRPFFFPKSYIKFGTIHSNPTKDLLFLGSLDNSRYLNNIYNQVHDLSTNNISVSLVEGSSISNKNIFYFPAFKSEFLKSGELYRLAHEHKAALITYNYSDEASKPIRYQTSLPHRMLMPLALGLPIVLPKKKFDAMEQIIKDHEVGLAYESIEELKHFLEGDGWMIAKLNLKKKQHMFRYDAEGFKSFVKKLIS